MIGTNLNLDLPTLKDTLSEMVTKTSNALSAIETSIADDVTPSAINIVSSLSMAGNWLTNVAGVIMADGNNPSAAGSLYYHNGEVYAVDHAGAVQLTLNGQINITATGGIGGDYGGANPALVSYNNASGQYRFYSNFGTLTFGDIKAQNVVVTDSVSGHTVTLSAPASLPASYTLTMPDEVTAAGFPSISSLHISNIGKMFLGGEISRTAIIPSQATSFPDVSAGCWERSSAMTTVAAGQAILYIPVIIPPWSVLQTYRIWIKKTTNGSITLTSQLSEFDATTGSVTANGTPGTGTETTSANNPGFTTLIPTSAPNIASGATSLSYYITFRNSGSSAGDVFYSAEVAYRPL